MALTWALQNSHKLATLDDIEKATGETPETLLSKPSLDFDLEYILALFFRVARTRPIGEEPLPILASEIEAVYRMHGVADFMPLDEFDDFMIYLDNIALEHYKGKKPPPKAAIPPR